jgi:hypothetical protein
MSTSTPFRPCTICLWQLPPPPHTHLLPPPTRQLYEDADLLLATYGVPQSYDPALIRQALEDLQPARARVMWMSKTLQVGV